MLTFTHRNPEMQLDKPRTALVLADIQNEFLDEKTGKYYPLIEEALKKRNVIANLDKLLSTAQQLGLLYHPLATLGLSHRWPVERAAGCDRRLSHSNRLCWP